MLFIKLLILIWLINFAPPFLANIFELGGGRTVDNGYLFFDGRPLFGKHKTVRGLLAGIISGGTIGLVLGFPLVRPEYRVFEYVWRPPVKFLQEAPLFFQR